MARPKKPGLEYFPKDTDVFSDRKIRRLLKLFGSKGYIIYEYVLCLVYQDKGYWLQWDKNLAFDVADNLGEGIKETLVEEVLNTAMKIGLFSVSIYEKTGAITSKGIQERYVMAKRNKVEIAKEFLVNVTETIVSETKTIVSVTKTPVNVARSTQSKVKESKVKESKVKEVVEEDVLSDITTLLKKYLCDRRTVLAFCENQKIEPQELEQKLQKFNSHLKQVGQHAKTDKDYKSHFLNWFRKETSSVRKTNTNGKKQQYFAGRQTEQDIASNVANWGSGSKN